MSQEEGYSPERDERKVLPIERGFPIERVNEIADKEGRAKQWYRPIYTMHKWWARRLGCVFRAISLYTLLDDPESVVVNEPGKNGTLGDYGGGHSELQEILKNVDMEDPESLWQLYPKDVRVKNKKVLDPFMGGGTPLVEASRFDASVVGNDLNPVAWFVTKKELEAGETDVEDLQRAFRTVKEDIGDEICKYYKTDCPNDDHEADVMYYFWVKELDCTSCGETVPLFKDYRMAKGRYSDEGYYVFCPDCESVFLVDDWRSECTCSCGYEFTPAEGNAGGGNYTCQECGQKYAIIDAIQEQDGFSTRLHGVEYYCDICEEAGHSKEEVKGYKSTDSNDEQRYNQAVEEWDERKDLRQYIPQSEIPLGILTDSSKFEGNITGGHSLLRQGYSNWDDLFNERQLLCISKILESIDKIEDQNAKEYLLLAMTDSLMFQNTFSIYNLQGHKIEGIFKTNSFRPKPQFIENNVWGTEYGRGTFSKTWEKLIRGVEYASAPTERYIADGDTEETEPFSQKIGKSWELHQGDVRELEYQDEFDAVISDPPYYDNVIYSEMADFFYVWQRILLSDEYDIFEPSETPKSESIVANPAQGKGADEFETEIRDAFTNIHNALKTDGALVFTYHHSDSESWGELLEALCDAGFEVTSTYPVNADLSRLTQDDSVSFDIIVVARPTESRTSISWNSLRRRIYRTAQRTRQRLEQNRELSAGDIGVIEMGECFHEYSKHHGKVMRAGKEMTAKEVVEEIYGVIQQGSDYGEIDAFLDLLGSSNPTSDELNKLCRSTNATPEQMEDMHLYRMEGSDLILGTWDDEKRIAYIQSRVEKDEELTDLDKAQFLRYRWEHGKSISDYIAKWEITDDLRELCEGLADVTGDDTYRNILESRLSDF